MSEDQGEGVTGRNAVDGETDIGMADSATRNFHDYLVVDGFERGQVDPFKGYSWSPQLKPVGTGNPRHAVIPPRLGIVVEIG